MSSMPEIPAPISVAIVDDHLVLVEALELVIEKEPDMQFAGSAESCATCLKLVETVHPAVLLLDVDLPDGSGLDLVPQINRVSPNTAILVLTSLNDENTLLQAIDLGVSGFVSKGRRLSETLKAIREVAAGEIAIPASLLLGLLGRKPHPVRPVAVPASIPRETLTARELEVLSRLAQGMSSEEIATRMNISRLTVRTHIRNMIDKLGVHSRLEAVTVALQMGLIEPPL
jgi:two-component system, NarL family, nitrate/nitrite response regulator NarL